VRILLFSFGKLKTPGLRDAADYYKKLIRPWAPIEEFELKPVQVPDKSASTRERIQKQEAELLLERVRAQSARAPIYLMDETGKALTTAEWAKNVSSWESEAGSDIAICVGSSLGFSDALRKQARSTFSLGPQTLPHELARVVLMEQLYRAWSVARGHPYHNAD
jgi:23S rRNA (pseudouridine1915-N3)-methyltransferase